MMYDTSRRRDPTILFGLTKYVTGGNLRGLRHIRWASKEGTERCEAWWTQSCVHAEIAFFLSSQDPVQDGPRG
jgi:hypothetical protein